MPSNKVQAAKQNSNKGLNSKFEEIQRKDLDALKLRVQSFENEDSEEEIIEINKGQADALFTELSRNYQGSELDVARIKQYLESSENIDCLICKIINFPVIVITDSTFGFRYTTSKVKG